MTVTVISFSFKRGLPEDPTDNGGASCLIAGRWLILSGLKTFEATRDATNQSVTSLPVSLEWSSRSLRRPRLLSANQ